MLNVLTLSSLFPDATRPNFGIFVERQTAALAMRPGIAVRVVAPIGLPVWPLARSARFRAQAALPLREQWAGLDVSRPRFLTIPGTAGRFHVPALVRALTPVLDRLRDEARFDVIDASFFFPDGPAAVALGRRYGVPVSIKARGADIHLWGHAPATRHQVARAAMRADGLLAVSDAMADDVAALGVSRHRIRVHHTGVDQSRFQPIDREAAKRALGVTGPLVVSLGALIPRKGHGVVIDAVARLPGVTLMIVGEGAERAALTARAERAGVADRVRLIGAIPHVELPPMLGAADVMALASASEGLANAWVESLACGTPVVITPAGGAEDVVTSRVAGRIAQADPGEFAAAIRDVLEQAADPWAVRAAVRDFTWPANAAGLHSHLAELVARGR
ncbi:glycosyltransferase [Sphingomonas yabuuchiae]|uniref:Glycosyltransferase n=1 Tax=Sphingomonas yabuuchiae TaxID=172044 RepID=A0AA41A1T8_9SPHN|nr:glycosyltransferase [Sphingomonas yabuuchiae]MBB4610258.1 glycosyltransferase involved in cell wall biosynthesis [Sphingomonas yabuuchiae]MBN3560448.1 glycosyltransferase [Sphingomonas yabuuchiae]